MTFRQITPIPIYLARSYGTNLGNIQNVVDGTALFA